MAVACEKSRKSSFYNLYIRLNIYISICACLLPYIKLRCRNNMQDTFMYLCQYTHARARAHRHTYRYKEHIHITVKSRVCTQIRKHIHTRTEIKTDMSKGV